MEDQDILRTEYVYLFTRLRQEYQVCNYHCVCYLFVWFFSSVVDYSLCTHCQLLLNTEGLLTQFLLSQSWLELLWHWGCTFQEAMQRSTSQFDSVDWLTQRLSTCSSYNGWSYSGYRSSFGPHTAGYCLYSTPHSYLLVCLPLCWGSNCAVLQALTSATTRRNFSCHTDLEHCRREVCDTIHSYMTSILPTSMICVQLLYPPPKINSLWPARKVTKYRVDV